MTNHWKSWTEEHRQLLRDLKEGGMSDSEIGEVLHRTATAVEHQWQSMNLSNKLR